MRFKWGDNNVCISEAEGSTVSITFWNGSMNSFGTVQFGEHHLRELRKWVTVQIRKLPPKEKISSKIKTSSKK